MVECGEELHLEGCTRPEPTQPYGRLPSMYDDPRWKTIFDGRRSLMTDKLRWKMTLWKRIPIPMPINVDDLKNRDNLKI